MTEPQTNIRSLFSKAKTLRKQLESLESSSQGYHDSLRRALSALEECRQLAEEVSLFSPNETEDDISSSDLQYLSIDYFLGDLIPKKTKVDRKTLLREAQDAYNRYLQRLDQYDMLSKSDRKLYETWQDDRDTFSVLGGSDASRKRDMKVARFKQEKELKQKLEYLSQEPIALQNDDPDLRSLYLAELALYTHQTFHHLDQIGQELKILALAPPAPHSDPGTLAQDYRERTSQSADNYSARLDPPISQLLRSGNAGPILSKDGKPLKPFTLLDSRQRLRDGVFRPDHSLPTMTIDEYLAEERRRGGIIEGGGEQSGAQVPVDEDDLEAADRETMKTREWDEFKENNPKGSGNTLNRG